MLAKIAFPFVLLTVFNCSIACTNIMIQSKDNSVVVGRTLEFGPSLNSEIVTSPKGKTFSNTTSDGQSSQSWTAKYGFVYLNFFGQDHAVDGMNDQGLSIGLLYLPGYTQYPKVNKENLKNSIPYFQLGDWVLSQFKTTEEARVALESLVVFDQMLTIDGQQQSFPLHLVINDAQGKSIVVEFNKGQKQIYENSLGVLTNSPTFDWQLTNLKNYANLSPYAVEPIKVAGMIYSATGQGAGMVGLPGDSTPPSRFVKVAFLQQTAFPVDNAEQAVVLSEHIIDNVFIPNGMVRDAKGRPGTETTQWTVFKDLKNGKLYFKSYNFPTLRVIDITTLNLNAGAKVVRIPVSHPALLAQDVTKEMK
ncbi:linear amide C-N hydrolase [Legionella jamestowniensis]|uniref:Choloylglycine hydrolase n=1 Tax=Legionella jamestowniensis TaxID=455 RepID=A0A0W0UL17_9GAMM|nr:choloylglycine hydrolase family protein [Legionella jamestowniensis]KTD08326.1 choloylglycine hydrolase [Legionella jamestowniensis]SFL49800.1 choloylglycine hydrolase [Legionella jamestowniensis DSM 19215]